MFKRIYILFFSSIIATTSPITAKHNSSYKEYKVRRGDTLFTIAKKYQVHIKDILKLNGMRSNSVIYPGTVLKIPSKGYFEKAKKAVDNHKKTVYKVRRDDTLSSIARKFNMSVNDLKRINRLNLKGSIYPGMELNVYATKKVLKKRRRVSKISVKKGDTLWSIAKRHNISVRELRLLNPKLRISGLKRGMILNVDKERAKRLVKLLRERKAKLRGRLAKYRKSYYYNIRKGGKTRYNKRYSSRGGRGNYRIVRYAKRFLGTPYVWGATSGRAFDCSGFTQYVFRKVKGKNIPRVSRRQAYYGKYVRRPDLIGGDLVFFDTSRRRRGYVNHVGIYIGNHKFIHASSAKHRVTITSLNKPFYSRRFMWGRRIN
jgi:LysM repeat protein